MLASKQSPVQSCFNKAALTYDEHNDVQTQVGLTLLEMIPKRYYATQVDLGCGTGQLTSALNAEFPSETLYAVDFAEQLLMKARERLLSSNVVFLKEDFDHFYSKQLVDLVYSNMALHWSRDLSVAIQRIYGSLNSQGCFAFTLPLMPTFHELKPLSIHPFLYAKTVIEWLSEAGFTLTAHMTTEIQLTFDTIRQALGMIKSIGANHVANRNKSIINKEMIKRQEPFQLTYHIGFFMAEKS